ncbi:hypothetical protein [Anatilimnocola aggregata]|nr:hypothetical protein [Anatilimnocola aggregata]
MEDEIEGFTISEQSSKALLQRDFEKITFFQQGCLNISVVKGRDESIAATMRQLTIDCARCLGSSYALMTTIPYGFVPPLWCGGVVSGYASAELPADDLDRLGRWMSRGVLGRAFDDGWLRGVYELNILNKCQANRTVHGTTLIDWVNRNRYGTWSEISENRFRWDLELETCIRAEHSLIQFNLIVQ